MNSNGFGGRRIGKRYYAEDLGKNIEEDSDYTYFHWGRRSVIDQIIIDYNHHNRFIKWQKKHWLNPEESTNGRFRKRQEKSRSKGQTVHNTGKRSTT